MVWLLQQLVRRIGPNQPKGAKRPLRLQLYIGLELGSSLWQPVSFQRIGSRGRSNPRPRVVGVALPEAVGVGHHPQDSLLQPAELLPARSGQQQVKVS